MGVTREPASAYRRMLIAVSAGVIAGVLTALLGSLIIVPLATWDTIALVYVFWMWLTIWPRDSSQTEKLAKREDPGRGLSDILLTFTALASLAAVGIIIIQAGSSSGIEKGLLAGFGVVSVVLSWIVIHTLYTLKYAEIYYKNTVGGVNFNQNTPPQYSDFAYLSFTIGMTFQVSDTDLKTNEIRRAALHQAHLSYIFGTIIIATTINLIVGFSK
jgi:uncharacterized membrane protein